MNDLASYKNRPPEELEIHSFYSFAALISEGLIFEKEQEEPYVS